MPVAAADIQDGTRQLQFLIETILDRAHQGAEVGQRVQMAAEDGARRGFGHVRGLGRRARRVRSKSRRRASRKPPQPLLARMWRPGQSPAVNNGSANEELR